MAASRAQRPTVPRHSAERVRALMPLAPRAQHIGPLRALEQTAAGRRGGVPGGRLAWVGTPEPMGELGSGRPVSLQERWTGRSRSAGAVTPAGRGAPMPWARPRHPDRRAASIRAHFPRLEAAFLTSDPFREVLRRALPAGVLLAEPALGMSQVVVAQRDVPAGVDEHREEPSPRRATRALPRSRRPATPPTWDYE
jgi:hypothetical protein